MSNNPPVQNDIANNMAGDDWINFALSSVNAALSSVVPDVSPPVYDSVQVLVGAANVGYSAHSDWTDSLHANYRRHNIPPSAVRIGSCACTSITNHLAHALSVDSGVFLPLKTWNATCGVTLDDSVDYHFVAKTWTDVANCGSNETGQQWMRFVAIAGNPESFSKRNSFCVVQCLASDDQERAEARFVREMHSLDVEGGEQYFCSKRGAVTVRVSLL